MFEKEAEEYYYKTYPVTLNIGEEERKKKVTDLFIKCAEFGYNKANEWHYVKDGDYPKRNQLVLLYRENPNGANVALTYWYESYVDDKVIAWKEIVLPKESE